MVQEGFVSVAPDVSVVVGAYNAMPYLTKCVSSVLEQSIGLDRLELITVDDGSTDGTGAELDRFAAGNPAMRVIHQENSGGPAGPRNRGIELARGRYIFFLDADDYLGVEALERMVAMADRNHSDVLVGRRVGVGGRGTPQVMFRENQDNADLFSSRLWHILSAQKLFRKELIDRLDLRFPDLRVGQDQPFTAMAYLHAGVISILADYDCYHLVRRDDGGNNTTRQKDIRQWLRFVETMMRLVAEHVPAGDKRDALMQRHFKDEFRRYCFSERFLDSGPEVRLEAVTRGKELIDAYYTPRIAAAMPVDGRLRFHLISRGMVDELVEVVRAAVSDEPVEDIVDKGRVYAGYPFFRHAARGIPDECYDITERRLRVESVEWVDGSRPVLRVAGSHSLGPVTIDLNAQGRAGYRVPAERDPDGAFAAVIPLDTIAGGKPLPYGNWRMEAEFEADGAVIKTVPVRRPPALRRRLWWRRGLPWIVGPRRWSGPIQMLAVPVVSVPIARAAGAAVRRRLSWFIPRPRSRAE
jgi:poly(ribitol-phosphate) beta-N-acetylglucosaminyltransferase